LNEKELESILDKALKLYPERSINEGARNLVVTYADGDARKLINLVEMLLGSHAADNSSAIDELDVKKIVADKTRRFDKGGDQFYDQISALHKSVRGSDPDAALYWLFKMLDGGADPLYLSRRIIRIAIEDIGLADPRAQTIALEAYQIYERLGFPEAELALSNAVIYLSMAPKSNSAYHAYNMVKKYIANQGHFNVPIHLKNAPTKLMDNLGYGKNYRYAHNEDHAYAAGEKYFPDELEPVEFYKPTDRGLEKKISEKKLFLRQLDQQYKNNKSE